MFGVNIVIAPHWTTRYKKLGFLPGLYISYTTCAFKKNSVFICRKMFLDHIQTGNLQEDTGRLCREGEDYSQKLVRH